MIINHGVEYYVTHEDFKDKSEKTSIKNYGTNHPSQSEKFKETIKNIRKEKGLYVEENEYKLYHNKVTCETKKHKQELLNNWDGLDYYDNKIIKENFLLHFSHKYYPTIDHKISIYYGFKNNILPNIISDIKNLCITTRSNNSSKSSKNEEDYIIS